MMSEVFQGVVVNAALQTVEEHLLGHSMKGLMKVSSLKPGLTVIFLKSPRAPSVTDLDMERFAMELSSRFLISLLIDYDSRFSHRAATVYASGVLRHKFGENDEMFVPLDENGAPVLHARPRKIAEFLEGEEYETILNSIQLGFSSFGDGTWADLKLFISRQQ
jgi:hypothetical protein